MPVLLEGQTALHHSRDSEQKHLCLVFAGQGNSGALVTSSLEWTTLSSVGVTVISQNHGRHARAVVQPYANGVIAFGLPKFPLDPLTRYSRIRICLGC